jgi:hypothetical protein
MPGITTRAVVVMKGVTGSDLAVKFFKDFFTAIQQRSITYIKLRNNAFWQRRSEQLIFPMKESHGREQIAMTGVSDLFSENNIFIFAPFGASFIKIHSILFSILF